MHTLDSMIPDVEVLLALAPEELAGILLQIADSHNRQIHLEIIGSDNQGYPRNRLADVELTVAEAWNWLLVHGMLIPQPDINGRNGWMRLTRRARKVLDTGTFNTYARSVGFQKALLHQSIADEVWLDIVRGDPEIAVFKAFRAVEIAVREAGGYSSTDIGVPLMRKAFNPENGPLSDESQLKAERDALMHLFAGAIGSYKNPHSHRTMTISDPMEAQEMVILASHLLRIVDSRRQAQP